MAVDLLPPSHEGRVQILLPFLGIVGHHAPVGHHNLQVGCVDPDAAVQVTLVLFDDFGAYVEDVTVHFIHLLPANVLDVVFGQVLGGQHERIAVLDVLEVGGRHR